MHISDLTLENTKSSAPDESIVLLEPTVWSNDTIELLELNFPSESILDYQTSLEYQMNLVADIVVSVPSINDLKLSDDFPVIERTEIEVALIPKFEEENEFTFSCDFVKLNEFTNCHGNSIKSFQF